MKPIAAVSVLVLLAAGCSKPTELASEANAKYDRRDAVVAAPPPDAEIDVAPVDPEPGSPEAEAPLPADAEAPPTDAAPPAALVEELPPPAAEQLPPTIEEGAPVEAPIPLTPAEPQPG